MGMIPSPTAPAPRTPLSRRSLVRRAGGLVIAALLAPALVGLAAAVVALATEAASPHGSNLWMLVFFPAMGAVCGFVGAASFATPWLAGAVALRRFAPGPGAWAAAGGCAGLSYLLAAAALSVAAARGAASETIALVFGRWPATGALAKAWSTAALDPVSLAVLASPPLAGLVAGWVYARIAGEG